MNPHPRHHLPLRTVANERGAVLALVVLLLVVFLGVAALAIDLGMLYVARGEAQRAADAAAHAGAGHLIRAPEDLDGARDRAVQFALMNPVRGEQVDIDWDTDIDILWEEGRVRARVYRAQERNNPVRTLFARVLGFGTVNVSASAAAEIWPATGTECALPIAIPDRWCIDGVEGASCNSYSDELPLGGGWDDGHFYEPWISNPEADPGDWQFNDNWTGYSTETVGDQIVIKPQSPHGAVQPGWFQAFQIPGNQGANDYRDSISNCRSGNAVWGVHDTVWTEQGNMVGPTEQGFRDYINEYPDAWWDDDCNCVQGSDAAKRVRPIVLYDPRHLPEQGHKPFQIAGFAALFIEDYQGGDVTARFVEMTALRPAATRGGHHSNALLKVLRIVE
jgi:hypothetical protein